MFQIYLTCFLTLNFYPQYNNFISPQIVQTQTLNDFKVVLWGSVQELWITWNVLTLKQVSLLLFHGGPRKQETTGSEKKNAFTHGKAGSRNCMFTSVPFARPPSPMGQCRGGPSYAYTVGLCHSWGTLSQGSPKLLDMAASKLFQPLHCSKTLSLFKSLHSAQDTGTASSECLCCTNIL